MVAIKDFGMPSCCFNCDMQINGYSAGYYCAITEQELNDNYTLEHRHPNCPLVEIEERKVGKWIMPDKYYEKNIWRKCSVCNIHFEKYHKYITFSGEVTYTEEIANYCKVCGAKMVGAEDE